MASMLIKTSKSPGWGKRKGARRQLKLARADAFYWAAQLGIDYADITSLVPAWERAGTASDIIRGAVLTPAGLARWDNNGLLTNVAGTASSWRSNDYAINAGQNSLVFLLSDLKITSYIASRFIAGQVAPTLNQYDWGIYSSGSVYIKTGGVAVNTGFGETFDTMRVSSQVGLAYDGATLKAVRNGVLIGNTAKTGTVDRANLLTAGSWMSNDIGVSIGQMLALKKATATQIAQLYDTPYALLEQRPWQLISIPVSGGTIYTEDIADAITAITSATTRQQYTAAATTLIQSGASVTDTINMLESVISLAQSQAHAADAQQYADSGSTTGTSSSAETDAQQYSDSPDTTAATVDSVTDQLLSSIAETLQTVAVSASLVSSAQQYVEIVTSLAQSSSSIELLGATTENLATVASTLSSVTEIQQYYAGVNTVAQATSSVADDQAFIDQVATTASSSATVLDILITTGLLFERLDLRSALQQRLDLRSAHRQRLDLRSPLHLH